MTKPGRTAIAILADRSRSLRPLRAALRAGLTALLADQRGSDVLVSLAPDATLRPIDEVTGPALRTRGDAALRDDLGALVTALGAELAATAPDERPSRVVVLVVGADVRGSAWSRDAIADLVGAQRRDYAWEFVSVGIGTDDAADTMGIAADRVLAATASDAGVRAGLAAASALLRRARDGRPWEPFDGFSDADRAAAAVPAAPATAGWWPRLLERLLSWLPKRTPEPADRS